jgi:23S rRNA (adenine-N6)-dimethyltransferase
VAVRRARRARRAPDRHLLRTAELARAIVDDACVPADALVLDIGAGTGRLTRELVRAAARVVAIEADEVYTQVLRRRFADDPRVSVVHGAAARVPLPRQPFRVVANLPFGRTTAILRRLLDPAARLQQADVIVEWDLARKRAAVWPSTVLGVCWSARHELTLVRRLPRTCFEPPPSVDAALLRIAPRRRPLVPEEEAPRFHAFVRSGFERGLPRTPALKRYARTLGIQPATMPRELDAHQWAALYAFVRRSGYSHPDT